MEGFVLHPNAFSGAFSKRAKRDLGIGCLKVKVAIGFLFFFVNNIFILHPCQLSLYTWNSPNGILGVVRTEQNGFLFFPQVGEHGRKFTFFEVTQMSLCSLNLNTLTKIRIFHPVDIHRNEDVTWLKFGKRVYIRTALTEK